MILKWFNFLFSFVTVLKSLLKNRNWIHKLFSPLNQIHFLSSSKMNSLPPTLAVFLSSPGTNHCVSTILNDRRAEWKRSTVRRPQCQHSPEGKYQGRLEWPYLIFQTNLYLIFQTKIPIQNFLLSGSNHRLAVPFSLSESFIAFEWERSKCCLEREKDENTCHGIVLQQSIWYSIQANAI